MRKTFWVALILLGLTSLAFGPTFQQEVPPRPTIRLDAGPIGEINNTTPYAYCWPVSPTNNRCDFALQALSLDSLAITPQTVLTVTLDDSPTPPTEIRATVIESSGNETTYNLQPATQAIFDQALPLPEGELILEITAIYPNILGKQAYVSYRFGLDVSTAAMIVTATPELIATQEATAEPTEEIMAETTVEVALAPSETPTDEPSLEPTLEAVQTEPTTEVVLAPSETPTDEPSLEPTLEVVQAEPTTEVVLAPSETPTDEPTAELALIPTEEALDEPLPIPTAEALEAEVTDEALLPPAPTDAPAEPTLEPVAPTIEPTVELATATSTDESPLEVPATITPTAATVAEATPTQTTVPLGEIEPTQTTVPLDAGEVTATQTTIPLENVQPTQTTVPLAAELDVEQAEGAIFALLLGDTGIANVYFCSNEQVNVDAPALSHDNITLGVTCDPEGDGLRCDVSVVVELPDFDAPVEVAGVIQSSVVDGLLCGPDLQGQVANIIADVQSLDETENVVETPESVVAEVTQTASPAEAETIVETPALVAESTEAVISTEPTVIIPTLTETLAPPTPAGPTATTVPLQTPLPAATFLPPQNAPDLQLYYAGQSYAPAGVSFCEVDAANVRTCIETPISGEGSGVTVATGFPVQVRLVDSPRPDRLEITFLSADSLSEVHKFSRQGDRLVLFNVEVEPATYFVRVVATWSDSTATYYFRARVTP